MSAAAANGRTRQFRLASDSNGSSRWRTLTLWAILLCLLATMAALRPRTQLSDMVGSASHYLTAASLAMSSVSVGGNSSSSSGSSLLRGLGLGGSSKEAEAPDPDLPCKESGYCSVGKTKPYIGEVDSTEGLKAAVSWGRVMAR
jgi:hypothetical protein